MPEFSGREAFTLKQVGRFGPDREVLNSMNETNKSAETLLDQLVERKMLELEGGTDRSQLAAGITRVLAGGQDSRQRATALAQWLLGQDAVAELFASDEELASVLEQW